MPTSQHHDISVMFEFEKMRHRGITTSQHDDISVMFVGGPNTRTDFHIEAGAEFFWQLEGDMELPIVQRGVRRLVRIREREFFLLPGSHEFLTLECGITSEEV